MTYEEFLDRVRSLGPKWDREYYVKQGELKIDWTTGGVTGGNCWGDSADQPVDGDPEPAFELLDQILELVCPNITYLQYKRMTAQVIQHRTWTDYEYYGNKYNKASKTVNLKDLYDYLSQAGIV